MIDLRLFIMFYNIIFRSPDKVACPAVGHKGHMSPSKYAPDEIQNSMILALM
jgi:hypothetical protein